MEFPKVLDHQIRLVLLVGGLHHRHRPAFVVPGEQRLVTTPPVVLDQPVRGGVER